MLKLSDEITDLFEQADADLPSGSQKPAVVCQQLADTIRERAVQEERCHLIRNGGGDLSEDAYNRLELLGMLSKFLSKPAVGRDECSGPSNVLESEISAHQATCRPASSVSQSRDAEEVANESSGVSLEAQEAYIEDALPKSQSSGRACRRGKYTADYSRFASITDSDNEDAAEMDAECASKVRTAIDACEAHALKALQVGDRQGCERTSRVRNMLEHTQHLRNLATAHGLLASDGDDDDVGEHCSQVLEKNTGEQCGNCKSTPGLDDMD